MDGGGANGVFTGHVTGSNTAKEDIVRSNSAVRMSRRLKSERWERQTRGEIRNVRLMHTSQLI